MSMDALIGKDDFLEKCRADLCAVLHRQGTEEDIVGLGWKVAKES